MTDPRQIAPDTRRAVLALVAGGRTVSEAARRHGVPVPTADYWVARARRTGALPPLRPPLAAPCPDALRHEDRAVLDAAIDMTEALQPRFSRLTLVNRCGFERCADGYAAVARCLDRGWLAETPGDALHAPTVHVTPAGFDAAARRPLWHMPAGA